MAVSQSPPDDNEADSTPDAPSRLGGWEPAGEAVIKEVSWSACEDDAILYSREADDAWLTATVVLDAGDCR